MFNAQAAVEAIEGNMDSYDPDLLPGIPAFPEALAREGVCVGLVTGNLEPICWLKMKKARLDHCFIAGMLVRVGLQWNYCPTHSTAAYVCLSMKNVICNGH